MGILSIREMINRMDVHYEIQTDGSIKVMQVDEEFRFQRGTFNCPHNSDPSWVQNQKGEYLLATTTARNALIIHYPIGRVVIAEEVEVIESDSNGR